MGITQYNGPCTYAVGVVENTDAYEASIRSSNLLLRANKRIIIARRLMLEEAITNRSGIPNRAKSRTAAGEVLDD